ncbi:MAG TPA: CHASE3 domain-containing protein [Pyrinomonadaceae bacterium]|mgnify:CR=1 FL=1|nr:CHASE3 domain-containing protein [Pyrinomonadaceae bacterium]
MFKIIGKRLGAAFAVAIVLLIVNAVISFRATNTLIENNKKVVHTLEVIETLRSTLYAVTEAESSQRGFLISGKESFLEIFNSAAPRISEHTKQLSELTSDNHGQSERVVELERSIEARLVTMQQVIQEKRAGGIEAVLRSDRFGIGAQQMAEVRRIASDIEKTEERLLEERIQQSDQSARETFVTFLAANMLVLGLMGLVYFLVGRDISERKRSAARLREAHDLLENRVKERTQELATLNTELERSNRELQDFAYVASHDLQEPLRKIQAFSDRLTTKHASDLPTEARDYIERMKTAAARMHTLINDLLTFSRVTTNAQPFEATDLNEIVEEVIGDLEIALNESGGTIDVDELPVIDADPVQMRQLFQNLIGNALKFHRPDEAPAVKVSCSRSITGKEHKGRCTVTVTDNGIGFDEKYLDRIFTPFQRLHGRNTYAGTGIGLAVCRKIVERHRGTITAQSSPDAGSTFIVTLPIRQAEDLKVEG